jgi:hypothetical protein
VTPPPAPALVIAGGIGWNYLRSRQGRTTISRWACEHKRTALVGAGTFCAWWLTHWALYVIELD